MTSPLVVWHGTESESYALLDAIARNCECRFDDCGALVQACAAHYALTRNQRFLDGLLYGRRVAERFIREEWQALAPDWASRRTP